MNNVAGVLVPALRSVPFLWCAVLSVSLFLVISSPAFAQRRGGGAEDSLQVERLIELYGPGDLISNARRALAARLRDADYRAVSSLLLFMPKREGGNGWLSPEEEVLVRTLTVDLSFLRNQDSLTSLLAARVQRSGGNGAYNDPIGNGISGKNLLETLREWLRGSTDALGETVAAKGANEVENAFFFLLINAQQVSGVRKVAEANQRVDQFVAAYSSSPYVSIADRYLRLSRVSTPFGAGFFLGYTYGGMVGSGSGIPGRSDGPTIGGELYFHNWTATGELLLGRLALSDSFTVRGRTWQPGSAVLVGGTLGVGYEFRTGDGLITPFIGGAFFDLQEDVAEEDQQSEQSTGMQTGITLGAITTYRIPFDHGPHLDLRLRVSAIFPGFGDYHSALKGNLLLVGASFGFVGRPYRVEPARDE